MLVNRILFVFSWAFMLANLAFALFFIDNHWLLRLMNLSMACLHASQLYVYNWLRWGEVN